MATTPEQLRRELLLEMQSYDADTQKILNQYILEIERASRKHKDDMNAFQKAVVVLLGAMFIDFSRVSTASNAKIAGNVAKYVDNTLIPNLRKAGAVQTAATLKKSTVMYSQQIARAFVLRRNPVDNRSFSQRIVTLNRGSEQMVDKLIRLGIKQGNSVNEIARAIEGYIDPASQSGRRITSGSRINYRMVKTTRTKIPKGSIKYNAVRIARSESMQTYDNASKEYYEDKPWSEGWDWFTSNTHVGPDACDDLRKASPHKVLPKRPHPQCTCNTRARLLGLKDFEQLVKRGVLS